MDTYFKVIKLNYKIICGLLILTILSTTIFVYNNAVAHEPEGIRLPIIMYHSILKSKKNKYIATPEQLENDLKYIKEKGYTTINMTDLIDFVYKDKQLPEKPIMITFDDGHYNNLEYVVPLLKKYGMKAVVSVVGKYTDEFTKTDEANVNYGYLRWKDINELIADGTLEVQNHSYDLHKVAKGRNGSKKKAGESLEDYKNVLKEDIMKLQEEFKTNTNYIPNTFTYPFGAVSKESTNILKDFGFKATLSVGDKVNYITKDKECLYLLKRYNRSGNKSTESFFNKIEKKVENIKNDNELK